MYLHLQKSACKYSEYKSKKKNIFSKLDLILPQISRSLIFAPHIFHVCKGPSMTCDTSVYLGATDLGNLIGSVSGQSI